MNTKEQIIDFIKTADEADLCVLAAITMGKISLSYPGGTINFKVYSPDQTYECKLIILPPISQVGQLSVSQIQSCKVSESTIKMLYSKFLKTKKGVRNEQ